ncbi:MAG: hypothetical protein ACKO90_29810, partial [Microcystis panniformis]
KLITYHNISYQLSVTSNQLSVTSNQLSVTSNQLSVTSKQLSRKCGVGRTRLPPADRLLDKLKKM